MSFRQSQEERRGISKIYRKMKKIFKIATLILLTTIISCQDVVDVDLETTKERLVIEALIRWENGTQGNEQIVKLSKTASFYNNQIVPVDNANIVVKNLDTQQEFDFLLIENGIYQTTNFVPVTNTNYELEVSYNGEIYKATSILFAAPTIDDITQSIDGGFSLEDPEVNVIFQDFQNQEDFYRMVFKLDRPSENEEIENFNFIFNDSFQENNSISIFYENEDFLPEDIITSSIYKISEQFFDYLDKLELQADSGIGPFASPPINVKGNIINVSLEENYPYGFFSLNQIDKAVYVFE